jgi:hypothetical protein
MMVRTRYIVMLVLFVVGIEVVVTTAGAVLEARWVKAAVFGASAILIISAEVGLRRSLRND